MPKTPPPGGGRDDIVPVGKGILQGIEGLRTFQYVSGTVGRPEGFLVTVQIRSNNPQTAETHSFYCPRSGPDIFRNRGGDKDESNVHDPKVYRKTIFCAAGK
jgi:hypothetical protein